MQREQQIMTLTEASAYLKIHISTLYHLAQQGDIPASKVGNLWRFRRHRIDKWLDKTENNKKRKKAVELS